MTRPSKKCNCPKGRHNIAVAKCVLQEANPFNSKKKITGQLITPDPSKTFPQQDNLLGNLVVMSFHANFISSIQIAHFLMSGCE
jgi:hypothetical protein